MTEASERIAKAKAKWDANVVFLRWKKTKDLSTLKYYREAVVQSVLDSITSSFAESQEMRIFERARLSRFRREFTDDIITNFTGALYLWSRSGLPLVFFSLYSQLAEWGSDVRAIPSFSTTFTESPKTFKAPEVKYDLRF